MTRKTIFIIIVFCLLDSYCFGQNYDFIKVIPRFGIIFNNDSILFDKTTIQEVCKIFKIKYSSEIGEVEITSWDGFNEDSTEARSGSNCSRIIRYKTLEFGYDCGYETSDPRLQGIIIKDDKSLKVYTVEGLEMGSINPKISEIYPLIDQNKYVSDNKITYNLYTNGVSLQLDKLDNYNFKLIEIAIYNKRK
jgi:hypothetical protein